MTKTSVHQRKARDFIQREDWGNALVELERMLDTDANNPTLHNQIGDVFLRKDEVQRAIEHFEAAIDLYAVVGLHNNAVALCKKIMRLRPGRVEIRYRLARLRLDQGFRSEAAAFFCEYLDNLSVNEDAEALEKRCREMFDLLAADAPIGLLLEKLESAQRFVAAFEIVRTLAQRAADAGDDAGAKRFGEKMRSLRVLVERSGGRDLLADSAPASTVSSAAPRDAAPARATYEPNVLELGGTSVPEAGPGPALPPVGEVPRFASAALGLPAVDVGLEVAGGDEVAMAASADVERLASAAESVASGVFAVDALPEVDFDFSPAFALPAADAIADGGAGPTRVDASAEIAAALDDGAFEIDMLAGEDGFGARGAFEFKIGDANRTLEEDDLQLPPGVRLIGAVEATPAPLARPAFELPDEVFATPPASLAGARLDVPSFDLGLDSEDAEPYFGALAAALDSAAVGPAAPPLDVVPAAPFALSAAPATLRPRDWAVEQSPNWDPASLAPPPEPVLPVAPRVSQVTEWVDELRRSSVWIPSGDTLTEPDPTRPDRGLSMELESVIDSFREQMSRALDGDGSARYDLGVAYYDMGLYNEALAEFEAAAQSPGLEVQSFEMLAQCLLQTGRHAEILELLLPVIAADGHAPRGKVGMHYCVGLAYEGLGDFTQARRHYEEVALVDVDFKDIQTRLQRT